ncbi:hypothetical protein OAX78_03925 [Planctomycetota bacterium]|nr:hypothetical protein [Planctomycetota bacterium]
MNLRKRTVLAASALLLFVGGLLLVGSLVGHPVLHLRILLGDDVATADLCWVLQRAASTEEEKDEAGRAVTRALRALRPLAEAGDIRSMVEVGWLLSDPRWLEPGDHNNLNEATYWFRTAAQRGDSEAQAALDQILLDEPGLKDPARSFEQLLRNAEHVSPNWRRIWEYRLGVACLNGNGTAKDIPRARHYLGLSANNGYAAAVTRLAELDERK